MTEGMNPHDVEEPRLIMEPGLEVSVVPYLYDLGPDHTGRLFLESLPDCKRTVERVEGDERVRE